MMSDASTISQTGSSAEQQAVPERSWAAWYWTAFILCFFGLQALLWTSAISLVQKYPMRPAIDLTEGTTKLDSKSDPEVSLQVVAENSDAEQGVEVSK